MRHLLPCLSSWGLVLLIALSLASFQCCQADGTLPDCDDLQMGQYYCGEPDLNPATGEPFTCQPNNTASVECVVVPGVSCNGALKWNETIPCRYSNGTKLSTTLGLSIFLGVFGVDRFYLGYPAMGLFKLLTGGFFFVGYYLDIILIATQQLGPADGTYYEIPVHGPRLTKVRVTEDTYRVPISE